MMDLDRELWRLGIPAKTRHNEVAPGQFEMAPVFEPTSVGSDHNMVVMSLMRRLATQHGLMFLSHEKPFAGINGSGKHNNWSMATDEGENLLDPGNDPHANAQFLAFLVAVIRAVNVHADLLRASIADAGQDHRLGANEAPPAIMSIFLGSQLEDVVEQLGKGATSGSKKGGSANLGVTSLPVLPKDATDRNRTSPFAFTGNKFEFRAVGSSAPIYWPQTVLNTAVADSLEQLADALEKLDPGDFTGLTAILSKVVGENQQVLFEGNGYSEEWHAEAARRGLPNNRTTVDALPSLTTDKAKKLFSSFGRPLGARTRGACGDQLGALHQGQQHRGELRPRHGQDDDPAGHGAIPRPARGGAVIARHQLRLRRGLGPGRLARRFDPRARARAARGARRHIGAGRGARVLRQGHPGAERTARGRRRTRDARRRRSLAAAQVLGAALPVLTPGPSVAGPRGKATPRDRTSRRCREPAEGGSADRSGPLPTGGSAQGICNDGVSRWGALQCPHTVSPVPIERFRVAQVLGLLGPRRRTPDMRRSFLAVGVAISLIASACSSSSNSPAASTGGGGGTGSPAASTGGGGSSPAASTSGYDPSAITGPAVLSGWQSSPAEGNALTQTVLGFQSAFPNVKVDYEPVAGDYPTVMATNFRLAQRP